MKGSFAAMVAVLLAVTSLLCGVEGKAKTELPHIAPYQFQSVMGEHETLCVMLYQPGEAEEQTRAVESLLSSFAEMEDMRRIAWARGNVGEHPQFRSTLQPGQKLPLLRCYHQHRDAHAGVPRVHTYDDDLNSLSVRSWVQHTVLHGGHRTNVHMRTLTTSTMKQLGEGRSNRGAVILISAQGLQDQLLLERFQTATGTWKDHYDVYHVDATKNRELLNGLHVRNVPCVVYHPHPGRLAALDLEQTRTQRVEDVPALAQLQTLQPPSPTLGELELELWKRAQRARCADDLVFEQEVLRVDREHELDAHGGDAEEEEEEEVGQGPPGDRRRRVPDVDFVWFYMGGNLLREGVLHPDAPERLQTDDFGRTCESLRERVRSEDEVHIGCWMFDGQTQPDMLNKYLPRNGLVSVPFVVAVVRNGSTQGKPKLVYQNADGPRSVDMFMDAVVQENMPVPSAGTEDASGGQVEEEMLLDEAQVLLEHDAHTQRRYQEEWVDFVSRDPTTLCVGKEEDGQEEEEAYCKLEFEQLDLHGPAGVQGTLAGLRHSNNVLVVLVRPDCTSCDSLLNVLRYLHKEVAKVAVVRVVNCTDEALCASEFAHGGSSGFPTLVMYRRVLALAQEHTSGRDECRSLLERGTGPRVFRYANMPSTVYEWVHHFGESSVVAVNRQLQDARHQVANEPLAVYTDPELGQQAMHVEPKQVLAKVVRASQYKEGKAPKGLPFQCFVALAEHFFHEISFLVEGVLQNNQGSGWAQYMDLANMPHALLDDMIVTDMEFVRGDGFSSTLLDTQHNHKSMDEQLTAHEHFQSDLFTEKQTRAMVREHARHDHRHASRHREAEAKPCVEAPSACVRTLQWYLRSHMRALLSMEDDVSMTSHSGGFADPDDPLQKLPRVLVFVHADNLTSTCMANMMEVAWNEYDRVSMAYWKVVGDNVHMLNMLRESSLADSEKVTPAQLPTAVALPNAARMDRASHMPFSADACNGSQLRDFVKQVHVGTMGQTKFGELHGR